MAEQCKLLKMIAANQVQLAKLLKGSVATGGKGPGVVPTVPLAPVPSGGAPPAPSASEGGTLGSPGLPQSWAPFSIHLLRMKVPTLHPYLSKLPAMLLAASGATSQV